jgi:hypothetical protein
MEAAMRAGIVVLGFALSLTSLGALADKALGAKPATPPAPADKPAVRMVWVDVQGVARTVRAVAFMESRELLASAGIEAKWETSDGRGRTTIPGEFQVVVLAEPIATLGPLVMGAAQSRADGSSRNVWVFLAGVRAALGLRGPVRGPLAPPDALLLGRAVGRVILHEVVHATAPERPHSLDGLMARCLGRATLARPRLLLEPELRDVFRVAAMDLSVEAPLRLVVADTGEMMTD